MNFIEKNWCMDHSVILEKKFNAKRFETFLYADTFQIFTDALLIKNMVKTQTNACLDSYRLTCPLRGLRAFLSNRTISLGKI